MSRTRRSLLPSTAGRSVRAGGVRLWSASGIGLRTNKLPEIGWVPELFTNNECLLMPPEGGPRTMSQEMAELGVQNIGFWLGTFLAAGVVSELAAKAAGVVETLPWEETIDLLE